MKFKNLARFSDIGSNSYLLDLDSVKIVLDAGTHPKHIGKDTVPLFESLSNNSVDYVFISHPHLDHVGSLPVLLQRQESAITIMTKETIEFSDALLHNSVNVMKSQGEEFQEPSYPLYSHKRVDKLVKNFVNQEVGNSFRIGNNKEVECKFYHAGHVLGSVGIGIKTKGKTIFYTGDVNFEDQTILKSAQFPNESIDTLIVETTRGNNPRAENYTRNLERNRLGNSINKVLNRGGSVLIPVFAYGKTQELLLMINELKEENIIEDVPVHIGGLSTKMSQITDKFCDSNKRKYKNYRIMRDFDNLHVLQRGKKEPKFQPGHIYALSSGMMSENTVSHRFSRHILKSYKNAILFVGYADPDTPGGRILKSRQGGSVYLDGNSERKLDISCEIDQFDFSGHAPRDQILNYIIKCNPKNVILVHGDEDAKSWFKYELDKKIPKSNVIVPKSGQEINI